MSEIQSHPGTEGCYETHREVQLAGHIELCGIDYEDIREK